MHGNILHDDLARRDAKHSTRAPPRSSVSLRLAQSWQAFGLPNPVPRAKLKARRDESKPEARSTTPRLEVKARRWDDLQTMSLAELKDRILALPPHERHDLVVWLGPLEGDYGDCPAKRSAYWQPRSGIRTTDVTFTERSKAAKSH